MADDFKKLFDGGTITGRLSREPIPMLLPAGEFIVSKRDVPVVDYSATEARIMATLDLKPLLVENLIQSFGRVSSSAAAASEGMDRFNRAMELHSRQLAEVNDRLIMKAIYGPTVVGMVKMPPGMFNRERRIASLLVSADPRKRKRGDRLFKHWRRTRLHGLNLHWRD